MPVNIGTVPGMPMLPMRDVLIRLCTGIHMINAMCQLLALSSARLGASSAYSVGSLIPQRSKAFFAQYRCHSVHNELGHHCSRTKFPPRGCSVGHLCGQFLLYSSPQMVASIRWYSSRLVGWPSASHPQILYGNLGDGVITTVGCVCDRGGVNR